MIVPSRRHGMTVVQAPSMIAAAGRRDRGPVQRTKW
jgi:hypothetical protein